MGNSGSYGLQIDVQRVAMDDTHDPRAVAQKKNKVMDSYSFGISSSGMPYLSQHT